MRCLAVLLILLWTLPASAGIFQQRHLAVLEQEQAAAGGGGTTPDWSAALDDNAANSTVTADYGSDGELRISATPANTSTVYSADGPSFSLTDDQHIILTGALTDTAFEDGDFAIQFDMKSSTSFSANWERVWSNDSSETQFMANTNSDTAMTIYVGGSSEGAFTVGDMADGTWKTYRIVVATGDVKKVVVYQGANEASLSEADSSTGSIVSPTLNTGYKMRLGGNTGATKSRVAQYKNWKIWHTSVDPGE